MAERREGAGQRDVGEEVVCLARVLKRSGRS